MTTIAAFFDLDGTIMPASSLERRYLGYLAWRGDLKRRQWLRAAARMLPLALRANRSWETRDAGEAEWPVLAANNKAYLTGVPCWTIRAFCAWLRQYPVALLPDARRRMAWHIEQGHAVFLVTGTLAPLAEAIARVIHPTVEALATQIESANEHCTGNVTGRAMAGIEKSRAMARLAATRHWHLQNCFAYGDSWADRWMLARVGHAVAVNPSAKLAKLAQQNGWPIARWPQEPAPAKQNAFAPADARFLQRLQETAQRNGYAAQVLRGPAQPGKEAHGIHTAG